MLIGSRATAAVLRLAASGGCVHTSVRSPSHLAEFGAGPGAAFSVGVATRVDVKARYATPTYHTSHNRAWGYSFAVKDGEYHGLVFGSCMPYLGEQDSGVLEDVWLEFDAEGVLRLAETRREDMLWGDDKDAAWRRFVRPVPDAICPTDMRDGRR